MSKEELFHEAFLDQGGRYESKSFEIQKMLNSAREIFEGELKILRTKYPTLPDINADFIKHSKLNACARVYKDEYYVGITIGLYFNILDLFNSLLSCKHVMTDIGNPSMEIYEERVLNWYKENGISVFDFTFPNDIVSAKCPIRLDYARNCCSIALQFIINHEFGHLIRGHLSLQPNRNWSESLDLPNPRTGLSYLDHQTCEMDADSFAINRLLIHTKQYVEDPETITIENMRKFHETLESSISITVFSVYSLMKVFGFAEIIFVDKEHPAPIIRIGMILWNIASIMPITFSNHNAENVSNAAINIALKVEKAMESLFLDDKEELLYFVLTDPEVEKYSKVIRSNWNKIRPKLEGKNLCGDENLPPYVTE